MRRLSVHAVVVLCLAALTAGACDDPADSLNGGRRGSKTGRSVDSTEATQSDQVSPEEALFKEAEAGLLKQCGKTCHDTGTFVPPPPAFLAGPDLYKSIKGQPGIVTRDVYASALVTKGVHAGPSLSQDVELEKKVLAWLEAEAVLIQSQKLPTTPPFTVAIGANDIDLTPAASAGVTGVHLKFNATMVGTMLSLSNITVVVPAGSDVHVLQPRFVRVLPAPREDGSVDVLDPADSFSNADQTIPNGKETPLSPGSVLFSSNSWRPFNVATDKLRIEITKLEPGKVSSVQAAASCKNVQGFTTNVLNQLRGQQTSAGQNCQGCHGNGLAGLNLASQDNALICQQVLSKLNQGNPAGSLIVTKVTGGMTHNGGTVPDGNAWRDLFVNNIGVFF